MFSSSGSQLSQTLLLKIPTRLPKFSVLPFASVAVHDTESSALTDGTITQDNGNFEIENLDYGDYYLVVSFLGFQTDTLSGIVLSSENPEIPLGTVYLQSQALELEGVEVVGLASTTSRKIDRQTYRADHFGTARGGTATDILANLPSLSVNHDGEVTLRGSTDFAVYLNGKPTQMEASVLLGQIPANTIASIDVITLPTARMEAQGSGGIVNITTTQSVRKGWSVQADAMAGGVPWANKVHKYSDQNLNYDRWGGGLNLHYRNNKISFYGNLNYSTRNLKSFRSGDARLLQPDDSYYHMIAEGERLEWQENYGVSAGMDYHLDTTTFISASYFYGHRNKGRTAHYVYHNYYGDIDQHELEGREQFTHHIYNPNTDDRNGNFHTGSVDFSKNIDQNSKLQASLLYEHSGLNWSLQNPAYAFDAVNDQVGMLARQFYQTDDTPLEGARLSLNYQKNWAMAILLGWVFNRSYSVSPVHSILTPYKSTQIHGFLNMSSTTALI